MAYSLTDSLAQERFHVVDVDKAAGRLRVKAVADVCTDFACHGAEVFDEAGDVSALDKVLPGDIITMEQKDGQVRGITVVRRAYEEYSSPEW